MKLKIVDISAELIETFLQTGKEVGPVRITTGIPQGAKLVAMRTDPDPYGRLGRVEINTVRLIFEHDSFPEIEPHVMPEPLVVTVEQVAPFPQNSSVG